MTYCIGQRLLPTLMGGLPLPYMTDKGKISTEKIESLHPTQENLRQAEGFSYDSLNRLRTASAPTVVGMAEAYSHRYVYDQLGNITSNGTITTTYGYHATQKHAVISTTVGNESEIFAYDANGNMIARQNNDYTQTFDHENRLVKVVTGSQTTTFRYDASGQRTTTIEPNGSITYTPFPGYEEEVGQLPSVTNFEANDQTIAYVPVGHAFNLAWSSAQAESCTGTGEGWNSSSPNGNQPITLTSNGTRTYTLVCENQYGSSNTAQVTVHVGDLPTVTLTADGQGTFVVPVNQTFTLAWSSPNASSCTSSWTGSNNTSGTYDVSLSSPQTLNYTRTCSNDYGETTSDVVSVQAVYAPTVDISAGPNPVSVGQPFTLEWDSEYTTGTCGLSDPGGLTIEIVNSSGTLSNLSQANPGTYTYTIQCSNAYGMTTNAQVAVVVVPLPTLNFTVNGHTHATVAPRQNYTLAWESLNASSCTASGAWSGSKATSGSESFIQKSYGLYSYTLTCANAAEATVSETVTVSVEELRCPGGCGGGIEAQLPLAPDEHLSAGLDGVTKETRRTRLSQQMGGGEVRIQRATYFLGGQAVALHVTGDVTDQNGTYYILGDHLGSANTLVKDGDVVSEQRFLPFGGSRTAPGDNTTPWQNRGYTGHLHNDEIGLIYMNARYYVPSIGRFASADTLVPDPTNPQSYNRYNYVRNNPLKYVDPTGHCEGEPNNREENISGTDSHCWGLYYSLLDGGQYGQLNHEWDFVRDDLELLLGISLAKNILLKDLWAYTWTFDEQTIHDPNDFRECSDDNCVFGYNYLSIMQGGTGYKRVKANGNYAYEIWGLNRQKDKVLGWTIGAGSDNPYGQNYMNGIQNFRRLGQEHHFLSLQATFEVGASVAGFAFAIATFPEPLTTVGGIGAGFVAGYGAVKDFIHVRTLDHQLGRQAESLITDWNNIRTISPQP